MSDVFEKKVRELHTTLGKIEVALGAISDAIVWTDRSGRVQWCNRPYDDLIGRPHIVNLGKPLVEELPLSEHGTPLPGQGHPVNLILRRKKDVNGYYEYVRQSQTIYLKLLGRYLEMPDSNETAVIVIRDISEEKDLDQIKLQSEALNRAANAIAITDDQGAVMWVNSSFRQLTGYSLSEVYGRNLGILKSDRHDRTFYRNLWETIQAGQVWEGEMINRRKDESLYTEQQTITPVHNGKGRITNFIAIKQDISARKRAEQEVEAYRDQLEQKVADKTRELEAAQLELVNHAMDAGMSQMAAIVLHNIGNAVTPLNVLTEKMKTRELQTMSRMLAKCHGELKTHRDDLGQYVSGGRGSEVFDYMGELIAALGEYDDRQFDMFDKMESALAYISQILTLQQFYSSGGHEIKEQVDLNSLMEDAIRLQIGAVEKRKIDIRRRYAEHLPPLIIDRSRLMQVIVNLLKNSYEAIGLRTPGTWEKVIGIKTFSADGTIGFEIADTGVGIDSEEIHTICDLGKSKKGSSGFGLYYCKLFVENNHGRLTVSSRGVGTGASVTAAFDESRITHG